MFARRLAPVAARAACRPAVTRQVAQYSAHAPASSSNRLAWGAALGLAGFAVYEANKNTAVAMADEIPHYGVAGTKHERTFIAVKPDGVQRGLVGEVVSRFEAKGYKLVGEQLRLWHCMVIGIA